MQFVRFVYIVLLIDVWLNIRKFRKNTGIKTLLPNAFRHSSTKKKLIKHTQKTTANAATSDLSNLI